jgi:hypothetical protein
LTLLTLATFLRAEFGFLGVFVITLVQTPRFCGDGKSIGIFFLRFTLFCNAGDSDFLTDF